ncbi:MAG TPA: SDR family NAD(P)-dependent oxidoreductase [Ilumatobacteraceae bacterium]|nr:SDR family NAD(P)-dependent oxidoreductase [Ilumatobacteraceae bacterium]
MGTTTRWPVCFITGGGSGIGRQLAMMLAAEGADVALFDLTVPDTVRDEIAAAGTGRVVVFETDVCDEAALASAVAAAVGELGPPSLAINSAGLSRNERFETSTLADFELTLRVNLIGSRNFAAAVLQHMKAGSRLALIASLAGITGGYTYAAYAASKAGVIGLAKVLRVEYAPRDIAVSVICPPEILTPMVEKSSIGIHPATRALKNVGGTLEVGPACAEMLAGLAKGRFTVIPGKKGRRAARLTRLLPERVTQRAADRIVASALREHPEAPR